MSLKAFHIVFVSCSVLLALGFGVWCLRSFMEIKSFYYLLGGVGSFAVAGTLVWYGIAVLKKLKDMSWM